MMKAISDKAEVSIDFPEKAYYGSFGRNSEFETQARDDGVMIKLLRPGEERRMAEIHLHYYLLADILAELARSITAQHSVDEAHRPVLLKALKELEAALGAGSQEPAPVSAGRETL
jgi:hypothetical protein